MYFALICINLLFFGTNRLLIQSNHLSLANTIITFCAIMERFKQFTPFSLLEFKAEQWTYPLHNHDYFEIIYIRDGCGTHTINNVSFFYKKNDLFLLSPEDYHSFEIEEETSFCFFKFTDMIFRKNTNDPKQLNWIERIESIMESANHFPGAIPLTEADRQSIESLGRIIVQEEHAQQHHATEIIVDAIGAILGIIARNISDKYKECINLKSHECDITLKAVSYIRSNIFNNHSLSVQAIADFLGFSKSYTCSVFKLNAGESIQSYIINYKLALVENRLIYSNIHISEIAYELGFTDLSHLNRLFKKKYHLSPLQYRKTKKKQG